MEIESQNHPTNLAELLAQNQALQKENARLRELLASQESEESPPLQDTLFTFASSNPEYSGSDPEESFRILTEMTSHEPGDLPSKLLERLIQSLPAALFICQDQRFVYVNSEFEKNFGYNVSEAVELPVVWQIVHPSQQAAFQEYLMSVGASEEDYLLPGEKNAGSPNGFTPQEFQIVAKNGRLRWISLTLTPLQLRGSPVVLGVAFDISIRRRVIEQLHRSEEQYRTLVQHLPNGSVLLFDTDLRYVLTEGTGLAAVGLSREMLEGKTVREAVPAFLADRFEPLYRSALAGHSTVSEQNVRGRIFLAHTVPVKNEKGEIFGGMVLSQDITERKQLEEQLAAEKDRLAITLESIEDAVVTTDTTGNIISLNLKAEQLLGWSEEQARGQSFNRLVSGEETLIFGNLEQLFQIAVNDGLSTTLSTDTRLIHRDGHTFIANGSLAPLKEPHSGQVYGVVIAFRDVTISRKTELELFKMQKLESLGLLAGGIAHDFNNILMAVVGNIGLVRLEMESFFSGFPNQRLQEKNYLYELLKDTEEATLRAKNLTQQLLTFARGGEPVKEITPIAELVERVARFALRGSNAQLEFNSRVQNWQAEVDPGQIEQVVHNLVINADQAMPGGGKISITVDNVSESELDASFLLQPGNYIRVRVSDNGVGIEEAKLNQIFDPYYTTKPTGSGMGLTTSFTIIKKHNGQINVSSQPNVGTTFTFYLPAIPAPVESSDALSHGPVGGQEKNPALSDLSPVAISLPPKKRLLVMDDETAVRKLLVRVLEKLSFEVEAVADGHAALEKYRERLEMVSQKGPFTSPKRAYDLVIMDLTIPGGMGGRETMARLLELDPDVRAIVASGYSDDPVIAHYRNYGFEAALIKPFHLSDLKALLNELLGN